ncbi:MAG: hypothetical protein FJ267_08640 [Planctomycetes bacterium]|nr:hypothetical protein [Planctomycetota bacterium]
MKCCFQLLTTGFVFLSALSHGYSDDKAATDRQAALPKMLKIEWKLGTDLPQGFQDSDGGFINGSLITACGFCSGGLPEDLKRKPGKYPRGFLKKVWAIDPDRKSDTWKSLPDFPGAARQGLSCTTKDHCLFYWGGFSYDDPFCYRDGWKLSATPAGEWKWEPLPAFPYPVTSGTLTVVGSRIYAIGGADYDGVVGFFTESDRKGNIPRMGAKLWILDTENIQAGWQPGPECPGTARFVQAAQAIGESIFMIGGATGDLTHDGMKLGYCTVVDNWKFDTRSSQWERLADLPVSSGNFPKSSNLVFGNRWIILPGGHQYSYVANPDGTVRPKFGVALQKRPASGLHNDVFVYDTRTNQFGVADKLPIDNNLPMTVVRGNKIYLIGGETGGGEIDGAYYGHHPDLLLIGTISNVE